MRRRRALQPPNTVGRYRNTEPVLANYHLLDAVRGDLLFRLGRLPEARVAFERALALASNVGERIVLERRVRECGGS